MRARTARQERSTRETRISAEVRVDGDGKSAIELPLPFFAHMVDSFVRYSGMDVELHRFIHHAGFLLLLRSWRLTRSASASSRLKRPTSRRHSGAGSAGIPPE